MAHNQMQFQNLIGKYKQKLNRCKKCGSFAQVSYYPGKHVTISCKCRNLIANRSDLLSIQTEESFALSVAKMWNKKA